MSPPEPRIRRATDGDVPAIVDLLRNGLGHGSVPRTERYWRWKHRENPFGASPVLVAEAAGELVALRAFQRWRWWRDGRPLEAVRAVDTVTHPEWRGRGLFTLLTLTLLEEMEEEGIAFVFNTPNEKSRPGYLKMGWSTVGRLTPLVRPLRPGRMLRAGLGRLTNGNGARAEEPTHALGAAADLRPVGELLAEPGLETFLDRLPSEGGRLALRPTAAYLRWRYAAVPGLEYRAAWSLGGDGEAVAIVRTTRRFGLRELRLCELLVPDTNGSVRRARATIRSVLSTCDADVATALASRGTPERRVLNGCGFLPVPRTGPTLTVRSLNGHADERTGRTRRAWRLSAGAMELF